MLTEIEWWGGVLIIWGALVARYLCRSDHGEGLSLFRYTALVTFPLVGLVFALYFYELRQPALRYAFLGLAAAAGVATLVFLVAYLRQDDSADEEEGEEVDANASEEDDEEPGWAVMSFVHVLFLSPLAVALSLVALKSWALVQTL
ncbi:hypothetical protein ACVW0Y_003707 [Pseudomonas sp. TE3786]